MTFRSWRVALAGVTLAAAVMAACQTENRNPVVTADAQARISANLHPVLRGTVGEYSALLDAAPIRVEGWGLVGGLPDTGSPIMDQRLHDMMLSHLLKIGVGLHSEGQGDISPEAILASSKVSVVEVRGIIPPLARRGTNFDLYINSLPGSGTTSLANGLLWPSDLKVIGLTLEQNDTKMIAKGQGPVFIPGPLEAQVMQASGAKPTDMRKALLSGRVIAGGVCQEDRESRLQLYTPDWGHTRLIERTINARFPGRDRTATAENDRTISLRVPAEYRDNPMDFVDLARHLYMMTDAPGFVEKTAGQIIEALQEPGTPHRDLGLALQGLGRSILPDYVRPYYTAADQELRFWCARAGAMMQDPGGMTSLIEMVKNPAHPLRKQALQAMIDASRGLETERATGVLLEMVRSYNTDERIMAYQALLAIRSGAVLTYSLGGGKFFMDVVKADSPPLIYIWEADMPRIAFIGRDLELPAGAVYYSNDRLLTVVVDDAPEAAVGGAGAVAPGRDGLVPAVAPAATGPGVVAKAKDTVTLFWRSPAGGTGREALLHSLPSLPNVVARACWVPDPGAANYDSKMPYIGVNYQRITEFLAGMVADKTIAATLAVQRSTEQLISPTDLALSGRPEGSTSRPGAATRSK